MESIVLLGAPGSGKGTAAASLEKVSRLRHVSTGALCREAMEQKTAWGEAIRPYMDRGELVPDRLVLERVGEVLRMAPPAERVLFDGFPRTVRQAKAFEDLAVAHGAHLMHVLLLETDTETLEGRLGARMGCETCGTIYNLLTRPPRTPGRCDTCEGILSRREDDRVATIRRRLKIYEERTAPLIVYYEERDLLRRIDAGQRPEDVVLKICELLDRDGKTHDQD